MPLSVRAKGVSLSTATNWAFNWIVGEVTPYYRSISNGGCIICTRPFVFAVVSSVSIFDLVSIDGNADAKNEVYFRM